VEQMRSIFLCPPYKSKLQVLTLTLDFLFFVAPFYIFEGLSTCPQFLLSSLTHRVTTVQSHASLQKITRKRSKFGEVATTTELVYPLSCVRNFCRSF
jgi:hypothetical protein